MRLISPANVGLQGYVVSKVLSEKEALRFAEEHGLSLAIACPVLTVGASPAPKVYTSVPASLSMLSGETTRREDDDAAAAAAAKTKILHQRLLS